MKECENRAELMGNVEMLLIGLTSESNPLTRSQRRVLNIALFPISIEETEVEDCPNELEKLDDGELNLLCRRLSVLSREVMRSSEAVLNSGD